MDDTIKEFIEQNIELIENNKWKEVYEKAAVDLNYDTGKFTEFMLAADIHPENYLKELPKMFLCNGRNISNFYIPNDITRIGDHAFYNCGSLASVTIPNSVTSIGDYAFYNCYKLINIAIPNNVTMVGMSTFVGCTGLTTVKIPDNITTISHSAFYGCAGLTRVTIPNSVTSIDYFAFRECTGLTSITIPNSVTRICDYAFTDCGDNLIIYYQGSKEDWEKIYNQRAFEYTYFTVNCTDGMIFKGKE